MFDWEEFLNLAKELESTSSEVSSEEANLRTSISRAYYAAFCETRYYLDEKHIPFDNKDVHSKLINFLKENGTRQENKIGVTLNKMRTERTKADYDIKFDANIQSAAKTIILNAETIFSILKQLRGI